MMYLASPYTSKLKDEVARDKEQLDRVFAVMQAVVKLKDKGINCYSPIANWDPIARICNLPKTVDYYLDYDKEMIATLDRFGVLLLNGWIDSIGIQLEIAHAKVCGKLIEYVRPNDMKILCKLEDIWKD